jgi:hypothetical protein
MMQAVPDISIDAECMVLCYDKSLTGRKKDNECFTKHFVVCLALVLRNSL